MRTDQRQRPTGSMDGVGRPRATAPHLPLTDWAESQVQSDDQVRPSNYRLQIAHDIRHELSTIMLLASTLMSSTDFGQKGRVKAQQLLGEAQWLDELLNAYDATPTRPHGGSFDSKSAVRLDELASDVVKAIELSCSVHISLKTQVVSARIERLAFWRALRNVICNALEAAGPSGTLTVRVISAGGAAIVEVNDDGPGFNPAGQATGSQGLAIVESSVASCGGRLEIGRSDLGGCQARLVVPALEHRRVSDRRGMRVVLCDPHLTFAESLAHVLAERGDEVLGIVRQLHDAEELASQGRADVCVLDLDEDSTAELDNLVACGASVVVLSTELDSDQRGRLSDAGVQAVVLKQQSLHDLLAVLDRVHLGEGLVGRAAPRSDRLTSQPRHHSDGERLAAFLSPRERQVLSALVRGGDTSAMARSLKISTNTARSYVQSVLTKLGAHSRLAAVQLAIRMEMVDPRSGEWLIDSRYTG